MTKHTSRLFVLGLTLCLPGCDGTNNSELGTFRSGDLMDSGLLASRRDAGGGPTSDDGAENTTNDPDLLSAQFLDIWKRKIAEDDAEQAGDATSSACANCISVIDCESNAPCSAQFSCVERHCLCYADSATTGSSCRAETPPSSLSECMQPCFADTDDACRSAFRARMQCVVDGCSADCL